MFQAIFCIALASEVGSPMQTPQYLYKVLSLDAWEASGEQLILSKDDDAFIHFSRDDQLERITEKYWADVPAYVILKIDTHLLPGRMVYEANPGGTNKYYHLYDGSIPRQAVVEAKIISRALAQS